jgi:hypothetical protein
VPWQTITEADVVTKLSGPENAAMQTVALKSGQANPLTGIISQVVAEIRGYVAACANNTLGEGETIPSELLGAAISRIRYELASRLPVPGLITEARSSANADAIALLRDVAACRFLVVAPETAAPDQAAGPSIEVASSTTRRATRDKLSGL